MLEKTHVRIAEAVASRLKLGKEEAELLKSGSTRPDYFEKFPHHKGKDFQTLKKIFDARAMFLKDDDEAFVKFGEALHYIADQWTLRPRTRDKHTKWEEQIETQEIIEPDAEFRRAIESAAIPRKTKEFYLDLFTILATIPETKDFSDWGNLFNEWNLENLENWVREVRGRRIFWIRDYYNVVKELDSRISKILPGGKFLPAITSDKLVEMRGTYSSPLIDLNFAFRVSLAVSHLVLERDIVLSGRLDWGKPPLDLEKTLNDEIGVISDKRGKRRERRWKKEAKERAREAKKEKGCFIATAAYGTALADEVVVLRRFRDIYMMRGKFGRKLVHIYYTVSPAIAEAISNSALLKLHTRHILGLLIDFVKLVSYPKTTEV